MFAAERVSRADAKLAVALAFGVLPADQDVEVITNAPAGAAALTVIDRQALEARVGG